MLVDGGSSLSRELPPAISRYLSGCEGLGCVPELFFVDVAWNISAEEVLETAGVAKMEMAHDDDFYVFDVVAGGFDGVRYFHLLGLDNGWEEICERSAPFL